MLQKSLIHFSVDGWGCVPSLLFDLRPNYGGGNEDNGDLLQKVPMYPLLHSVPPTLQQPTADPHLCWRLLDTHGQVWVSLLWGHCSFLLGPGALKGFVCASKSLFPQSCLSPGGSIVGLIVTSSKRAYAIPRSAAPRASAPAAGHCWPIPPQETLRHSKAGLVQSLQHLLVCITFCLSPLSVSGWVWGLIRNVISPLLPSCWGFSFALGHGNLFFWWDSTFSCWSLLSSEL